MKVIPAERFAELMRGLTREVYEQSMNFYAMSVIDDVKDIAEELEIDIDEPRNCSTWNKQYSYHCNNCRKHANFCYKYCPNCGARMVNGVKTV